MIAVQMWTEREKERERPIKRTAQRQVLNNLVRLWLVEKMHIITDDLWCIAVF